VLDDVYNQQILALAADIPLRGRLPEPQGSAQLRAKLCGSTVTVDVALEGETIAAFAQEVRACALGQASSSIMGRHAIGASLEELKRVREGVRRMLTEGAPPPQEPRWPELALLEPIRDFKSRHASTMLTFDATVEAAEKAIARRQGAAA
jgi:NifU-like protein involved in Fe-S cluster formation